MNDEEYKKLAGSRAALTNAEGMVQNIKRRVGRAELAAAAEYKDHKTDQPAWKVLATALKGLEKSISPTMKNVKLAFELGSDKKQREKLSLVDAKKQIKSYCEKMKPFEDAIIDVMAAMEKVRKELKKAAEDEDIRTIKVYGKDFIEYYNIFKVDVNILR